MLIIMPQDLTKEKEVFAGIYAKQKEFCCLFESRSVVTG